MELSTLYQVNFLPWRQQQVTKKKREFSLFCFVAGSSVAFTCCFLFIFQYLEIKSQQQKKHSHQQQYEQVQQLTLQSSLLQKQVDHLTSKKNRLDNVIKHNQFLLTLLQNLPTITPGKSWLTKLQFVDNKIEIKANSYDFQDINSLSLKLGEQAGLHHIQLKKLSRVNQLHHLHLTAKYQGAHHE